MKTVIHQTENKRLLFLNQFYSKISVGFCLNTGKGFFLDIITISKATERA